MTKKILWLQLLLVVTTTAFSQSDSLRYRKSYHYLGIQANQLARQLLNFGNASVIDNPYLIVYSVNSRRTGCGLNVGSGYTYTQSKDGDSFNSRETDINNFFLRAGFEKKSSLGKNWIASWGFDLVVESQKNDTKNTVNFGGGSSSTTETITKSNAFGIGPRLTLNYKITDRIIIGTETTYYMKFGKNSTEDTLSSGSKTNTDQKFKKIQLALPAVLLLIIKF
jgi:hypothetical protein